jgi:4-coumarate--CoA ligase
MSCLAVAKEAARLAGLSESRVVVIGDQRDPERKVKHAASIRDSMGRQDFSRPTVDPKKDIAFLAYSSGTTGWPKGVMLTHTNIVSNVLQMEKGMSTFLNWKGGADERGDKVIAFLPFFHIYGKVS